MSDNQTSRREFLRASVLTSALFGAEGALTGREGRGVAANGGEARNVILMVSDGMNHGALSLARQYQGLVVQEESNWMRMYRERPVVRCLAETFSANSCVTDSAAAASAWGGGQKFFSEALRAGYEAAGYEVVTSRRALRRAKPQAMKPILGIFAEGHLPFSIDRNHVEVIAEQVPTLKEMTEAALGRLQEAAGGFFLLVEGARIDHAGHANDAAASIHDQLAFDEAIGAALSFVEAHPDTLLIVTTDHGCGGIQMNGVSADANQGFGPGLYNASHASFDRIRGFERSMEWMKQNGIDALSGEKLGVALKRFTGLELTVEEVKMAQGIKAGWQEIVKGRTGIGWTSGHHTGELVEFCAYGPGSGSFPAFGRNFEVHDLILKAFRMAA